MYACIVASGFTHCETSNGAVIMSENTSRTTSRSLLRVVDRQSLLNIHRNRVASEAKICNRLGEVTCDHIISSKVRSQGMSMMFMILPAAMGV
jgi:hypothetical protein